MRCKHCGAETIRIHTRGGPAVCRASPTCRCFPSHRRLLFMLGLLTNHLYLRYLAAED